MRLMMCAVAGLALAGPVAGQSAAPSAQRDREAIGGVMVYQPAQAGAPSSGGGGGPVMLNWDGGGGGPVVLNWSGGAFQPASEGQPGSDAAVTAFRSYIQQQQAGQGQAPQAMRWSTVRTQDVRIDGKPVSLRITGASLQVYLGDEPYPESRMKSEGNRTVLLDSDGKPAGQMVVSDQRVELMPMAQGQSEGRLLIGVSLSPVDSTLAKHLKIEPEKATVISSVTEGWPASKAGLQSGDIILAVEGKDEGTSEAIRAVIAEHNAGDAVKLRVIRGGERKDVTITLSDEARASTAVGISSLNMPSEYLSAVQRAPQGLIGQTTVGSLNELAQAGQYRGQLQRAQDLRVTELRRVQADQATGGQASGETTEARGRAEREQLTARAHRDAMADVVISDGARVTVDIPSGGFGGRAVVATRPESDISRRLGALEERMGRIEKMLEKLTEQGGSR